MVPLTTQMTLEECREEIKKLLTEYNVSPRTVTMLPKRCTRSKLRILRKICTFKLVGLTDALTRVVH